MKTVTLSKKSQYTGNLVLVNANYPYHEDAFSHDLVSVSNIGSKILLKSHAVKLFWKIMEEINGWRQISAVSGWRSKQEQQDIYTHSLKDNGLEYTRKFVALPGHSEHQTGLAIDLALTKDDIDFICPGFPYTGISQEFREKAVCFGFIERYPKNKENITGIAHEPWHFRYVGFPHAEIMVKHGFCLEEYIDFLKQFCYGKTYDYHTGSQCIAISYVKAPETEAARFETVGNIPYIVSGNNVDGYIITEWR